MIDWLRYPDFSEKEFECRCGCGAADMDAEFMGKLQALRTKLSFPFAITSGYRCAAHNSTVGGGPAHPRGRAADIAVWGVKAFDLVSEAKDSGFTGVGVQQKGRSRFVHLDDLPGGSIPRPRIWSY